MTPLQREALQMCLEYIETDAHERRHVRWKINEALAEPATEESSAVQPAAQPQQEPKQVGDSRFESWYSEDFDPKGKGTKQQMREAYEAGMNDPSPPAQRNPLTDEEIDRMTRGNNYPGTVPGARRFARAIEAAHGIKGDA